MVMLASSSELKNAILTSAVGLINVPYMAMKMFRPKVAQADDNCIVVSTIISSNIDLSEMPLYANRISETE